jgi:Na+(H+)/acetate symporter ActP
VQRYLTGKSIGQSRLSLLFNAMAKIPMQFFILFIGTMVFVFFLFEKPPILFQPIEQARIEQAPGYAAVTSEFDKAHAARAAAARKFVAAERSGNAEAKSAAAGEFRDAQKQFDGARDQATKLAKQGNPAYSNDTNYIFLSFVTHYLPVGVVGLVIGVIFTAAMSAISGEINSLATVSVMDVYRRFLKKDGTDRGYLVASRIATAFWGVYAVLFASYGGGSFGALIEQVNIVGSLFYGSMLGVFVLAFFFKRIGPSAAFYGTIVGQLAIFAAAKFTGIAFLWYNVIGPVAVVLSALLITAIRQEEPRIAAS